MSSVAPAPRRIRRRRGWTAGVRSRLAFVLALAFAMVSPLRSAPREAEAEASESFDEIESSVAARTLAREHRRAHHGSARARAIDLSLPPLVLGTRSLVSELPGWQLPRRPPPPEDDHLIG